MREALFPIFLRLGLTSFGGPVAHIGYLREEFVVRRHWLDDAEFAHLLALCQFLPGPASSQLVFALGRLRGGWLGAVSAWSAFLLPSALLMFAFASISAKLDSPLGAAFAHALKLVAVCVVAFGLWQMIRALMPDVARLLFAAFAAVAVALVPFAWMPLAAIALGAVASPLFVRRTVAPPSSIDIPERRGVATGLLATYAALFALSLLTVELPLAAAGAFYRSGALVFGGGHVVLPLLQRTVVDPGWITLDDFLNAYGAAQIMPGPMFSVATYLGAHLPGSAGGLFGAIVATLAIFAPGMLLLGGLLPFWNDVAKRPALARAVAGMNAAVVGLLAAAFYSPVCTSGIRGLVDVFIVFTGIALLFWRRKALLAIAWCVGAALLVYAIGPSA